MLQQQLCSMIQKEKCPKIFASLTTLLSCLKYVYVCSTLTLQESIPNKENISESSKINKLIEKQTSLIKKLISNSTQNINTTRSFKENTTKQQEHEQILELFKKCQALNKEKHSYIETEFLDEAHNSTSKLDFLKKLKSQDEVIENVSSKYPLLLRSQGVSSNKNISKTDTKSTPDTFQEFTKKTQIHSVLFEPFLLQRIILANGSQLHHWIRNYPTISELASTTNKNVREQYININKKEEAASFKGGHTDNKTWTSDKEHSISEKVPEYEIEYNLQQNTNEKLYKQQMKFILPMVYRPLNKHKIDNIPSEHVFDQYAYYPKVLQPSTVQVSLPYVPTYHSIKSLFLTRQSK